MKPWTRRRSASHRSPFTLRCPTAASSGVRFTPANDGFIRGIRFYKSAANGGPHQVSLWTAGGTLVTQASVAEIGSGWQEVAFTSPLAVTAGTVYVASYHVNAGHCSYSSGFVDVALDTGQLRPPAGSTGVYAYGAASSSRRPASTTPTTLSRDCTRAVRLPDCLSRSSIPDSPSFDTVDSWISV